MRTHVILDGLQEPEHGRELSLRWARCGLDNAVDVAGQCAWLARRDGDEPLTEEEVDQAAKVARAFGVELNDRMGATFRPGNDLPALREQMASAYRARLAQVIMFGLPALVLHYLGPVLAGGDVTPRAMLYPWLFEALLVGWACFVAGWPVLWQGAASLVHLRLTPDLLTSAIILVAYVPSALGLLSLAFTSTPWIRSAAEGGGPLFHAALLTLAVAVAGRWLVHRAGERLSGRAHWMLPRLGRLIALWLLLSLLVMIFAGWRSGVAVAMLLPPAIGLLAINPLAPGWSALLPVLGFAAFFLLAPRVARLNVAPVQHEIAAGFALIATVAGAWAWRKL